MFNLSFLQQNLLKNAVNTPKRTVEIYQKSNKINGVTGVTEMYQTAIHKNALKINDVTSVTDVTAKKSNSVKNFPVHRYRQLYNQYLKTIDINDPMYRWKNTPPEQSKQYHAFNKTLCQWIEDTGNQDERQGILFLLLAGLPEIPETAGVKTTAQAVKIIM